MPFALEARSVSSISFPFKKIIYSLVGNETNRRKSYRIAPQKKNMDSAQTAPVVDQAGANSTVSPSSAAAKDPAKEQVKKNLFKKMLMPEKHKEMEKLLEEQAAAEEEAKKKSSE